MSNIDWGDAPPKAQWFAIDADGSGWHYEIKPERNEFGWHCPNGKSTRICVASSPAGWFDPTNWKHSLQERPIMQHRHTDDEIHTDETSTVEASLNVTMVRYSEVTAPEILQAGIGHMSNRAATYDKPEGERSMEATVSLFRTLTGIEMSEEQGWLLMLCLKLVRSQAGNFKLDNYEDLAAYAGLAGEAAFKARNSTGQ